MSTCTCPTCRAGRAMRDLEEAHADWIERDTDLEGNFYYLIDEVEASLAGPKREIQARLTAALTAIGRSQ